ncbi:MAG: outer membrane protein assembly factor BamE [Alphaproteobacteria bacterium]|nr:outer membrane protein assembly factor BamE [Alphaproteobacteria bacterium]
MIKKFLVLFSVLSVLMGCTQMIDVHGDKLSDEELDQKLSKLESGRTTYTEVKEILGTPSAVTSFDSEKWFYIYSEGKRQAFYQPEEIARSSVMINFDDNGVFTSYERKTMADGRSVVPNPESTPLNAEELSFYEQVTESIGKFGTNQPVY